MAKKHNSVFTTVENLTDNTISAKNPMFDEIISNPSPIDEDEVKALKQQCHELLEKNDELKLKIADYLDEISALKQQLNDVTNNTEELNRLRDENDKYLIKISQLTFELASAQAAVSKQTLPTNVPTCSSKPVQSPYNRHRPSSFDGTTYWN